MSVAFNNTPGVLRVPLFYAEVNPGVPAFSGRSATILIGRKLGTGALPLLKPVQIGSTDPNYLGGRGSMLADQIAWARAQNPFGEIWAMDIGDPANAQAAKGSWTLAGPATASGTLVRFVAGERYSVAVAQGDTAASVATRLVAAINAGYTKFNRRMGAPVTASIDGANPAKVVLTANHAGTEGNGISMHMGLDGDEMEVPGLVLTVTRMTGGSGDVDFAAALAALGKLPFDWITSPYNALSQLNISRDFLTDSAPGRWSPTVALDGHYITAVDGNLSALTVLGSARNDRHASIVGVLNYPHPIWSIAAGITGVVAFSKNLGRSLTEAIELAAPLQTLPIVGLRPPKESNDRWGGDDLAALYNCGISALQVNADNSVSINRMLTTYQTNLYGSADDTFLSLNSVVIAAYVKRFYRSLVTSTYPRHVLKDSNPKGIQRVVTVDQLRALIIHGYSQLANVAGIVDKPELFAEYVIVERSSDASRVNAYVPIDMADEFIAFAANITLFRELTDANASLL